MPMFISSLFTMSTRNVDENAKISIENARRALADAETELRFGDLAANLIGQHTGGSSENLSEIAVWHYERSVRQFRVAMGKFQIAGRNNLPAKYSRYIENKKAVCLSKANEAYAKQHSPKLQVVS